jgi:hypothetical protein
MVEDAVTAARESALPHARAAGKATSGFVRASALASGSSISEADALGEAARVEVEMQTIRSAVEVATASATSAESKALHFRVTVAEQLDDGTAASKNLDGTEPELLVWNHAWRAAAATETQAFKSSLTASGLHTEAAIEAKVKAKAALDKHGLVRGPSGKFPGQDFHPLAFALSIAVS